MLLAVYNWESMSLQLLFKWHVLSCLFCRWLPDHTEGCILWSCSSLSTDCINVVIFWWKHENRSSTTLYLEGKEICFSVGLKRRDIWNEVYFQRIHRMFFNECLNILQWAFMETIFWVLEFSLPWKVVMAICSSFPAI